MHFGQLNRLIISNNHANLTIYYKMIMNLNQENLSKQHQIIFNFSSSGQLKMNLSNVASFVHHILDDQNIQEAENMQEGFTEIKSNMNTNMNINEFSKSKGQFEFGIIESMKRQNGEKIMLIKEELDKVAEQNANLKREIQNLNKRIQKDVESKVIRKENHFIRVTKDCEGVKVFLKFKNIFGSIFSFQKIIKEKEMQQIFKENIKDMNEVYNYFTEQTSYEIDTKKEILSIVNAENEEITMGMDQLNLICFSLDEEQNQKGLKQFENKKIRQFRKNILGSQIVKIKSDSQESYEAIEEMMRKEKEEIGKIKEKLVNNNEGNVTEKYRAMIEHLVQKYEKIAKKLNEENEEKLKELETVTSLKQKFESKIYELKMELLSQSALEVNKVQEKRKEKEITFLIKQKEFSWVSTQYLENFRVKGKTIQKTKYHGIFPAERYQVLAKTVIKEEEPFTFHTKIVKTKDNWLIYGVVDIKKQKYSQSSFDSGNAVCYSGHSAKIRYGNTDGQCQYQRVQKMCKQGDTLTICVQLKKGLLRYFVNGKEKVSIQSPILKDRNRSFVPYLEIGDRGDVVQCWYEDYEGQFSSS